VILFLIDHNFEGNALRLLAILQKAGWPELVPMRWLTLEEVGLQPDTRDRFIWRHAQAEGMLLITNNRNAKGADSLAQTISEENTPASLPVLTVGRPNRLVELSYGERCAERLMQIVLDLDSYRGVGRLYIP
jgi:hypothetical protein